MRQRSSAIFNLACCLVVLSAAAAAYGVASRPAVQERPASAVPADTVVVRSPAEQNLAAAKLRAAAQSAEAERALFIPHPTHPQVVGRLEAAPVRASTAPHRASPGPLAGAVGKPAAVTAERSRAVLNDAQIASIKQRLNLTPEQEHMWPSVEAALRNLAYAKTTRGPHKSGAPTGAHDAAAAVAEIDPASADVQHLKSAAFPLIMSFSNDQMRELQTLTRVAGLDKLVPNF